MDGIRIDISGRDAAFARLGEIADGLVNAQPMYDAIGAHMELSIDRNFELEQTPDGNPWPKSLRALAEGGQTLTDSQLLRKSIIHNATAQSVEVGTNTPYAATHQFGATIKAKTAKGLNWQYNKAGANQPQWARKMQVYIPARPFIGINDDDETEIIAIAEGYLAGLAGGADAR